MVSLIAATLLVLAVRSTVFDWYRVTGPSMWPTLQAGEIVLCNRLAYGLRLPGFAKPVWTWADPQAGEIVIFSRPGDGRRCVKRVARPPADQMPPSSDYVWVVGDNSAHSLDSRQFGFVPTACLAGRVFMKDTLDEIALQR